jgi:hypothetical protein
MDLLMNFGPHPRLCGRPYNLSRLHYQMPKEKKLVFLLRFMRSVEIISVARAGGLPLLQGEKAVGT